MIARSRFGAPVLLAAAVALLLPWSAPAFDEIIDSPMYRLPHLPAPQVITIFPKGLKELWLQALQRPEVEMRVKAADAIALARERGIPDLDSTVNPLVAALEQPDQHPAVRLAAARALIALDARRSATSLFALMPAADLELRNLIEPALARWDHRPTRAVWLDRLDATATPPRSLALAIHGLGTVREEKAVGRLRAMVASTTTAAPIRLEAARALGAIRADGLVPDAEKLAADASERGTIGRLAAARLLERHHDPAAIALLQRLLRDRDPAVTVLAGNRLLAIDAKLLLDSVKDLAGNADPGARAIAVDVLYREPTRARLRMLSERLVDVHLDVRRKARGYLLQLARTPELRQPIIDDGMRVLAGHDWGGQEQAAILLTELDHKPAAPRCVALLRSPRPEVYVTAAWALRRLAVAETLGPVLEHVRITFGRVAGGIPGGPPGPTHEPIDHELSQLNQLLGQQKYAAAEPVLRQFIPKRSSPGGEARAAAVWALGMLHEGKLDSELAKQLAARVEDRGIPPEDLRVCAMAAIAIGRMKAEEVMPTLQRFWHGQANGGHVSDACGWAISRITGEPMPTPAPIRRVQRDWFLLPHGN